MRRNLSAKRSADIIERDYTDVIQTFNHDLNNFVELEQGNNEDEERNSQVLNDRMEKL